MKILLVILTFISFYIWCIADKCKSANQQIFIVIAIDGFKNSYFNETPFLKNFRETGAYTNYLTTNRLENALSSLQSVATGYMPRYHGVMGHETQGKPDLSGGKHDFYYGEELYDFRFFEWKWQLGGWTRIYGPEVIPIWTLNELYGGISACMMWPGSEFPYGKAKRKSVYTIPYLGNKDMKLENRLNMVINWLNQSYGQPNLVMIYIEDPDLTAHINGLPGSTPGNNLVVSKLKEIDGKLKIFIKKLDEDLSLYARRNVVFLSDHSMKNVAYKNLVDINNFVRVNCARPGIDDKCGYMTHHVSVNKVEFWKPGRSANCGCASNLYSSFVCHSEPERDLNYQRIAEIVGVLPPGMGILQYFEKRYLAKRPGYTKDTIFGTHGHEPDNDAIFMAQGHAFNTGIFFPFCMVDFYSLLAKLLKIRGTYNNDGDFRRVRPLIKLRRARPPINWIFRFMIIYTLAIIHCGAIYHYGNVREEQLKRRARERLERKKQNKKRNRK